MAILAPVPRILEAFPVDRQILDHQILEEVVAFLDDSYPGDRPFLGHQIQVSSPVVDRPFHAVLPYLPEGLPYLLEGLPFQAFQEVLHRDDLPFQEECRVEGRVVHQQKGQAVAVVGPMGFQVGPLDLAEGLVLFPLD